MTAVTLFLALAAALTGLTLGETLRLRDALGEVLPLGVTLGQESAASEKFFASAGALLFSTNCASVLLAASSACSTWPVSHVVQQSTRPHRLMLPRL